MKRNGMALVLFLLVTLIVAVLYVTQLSKMKVATPEGTKEETVTEKAQNAVDSINNKTDQTVDFYNHLYEEDE